MFCNFTHENLGGGGGGLNLHCLGRVAKHFREVSASNISDLDFFQFVISNISDKSVTEEDIIFRDLCSVKKYLKAHFNHCLSSNQSFSNLGQHWTVQCRSINPGNPVCTHYVKVSSDVLRGGQFF